MFYIMRAAALAAVTGPRFAGGVLLFLLLGLPGHAETVTGTGFAVTSDGTIITNHHVISECDSSIRARIEGSPDYYYVAAVVARDASRDLAALKLQQRVGQDAQGLPRSFPRAIFRKGPAVQQGERAITYGFPLRGLLATNGNLTSGYVSALSGLGDDRNYIQITTPVQQGNSGGPLYDGSGHVIGVVVAKLSALRVMLATGDVPQNVNFAVELSAVRQFLVQSNVQVAEEETTAELPLPEIAQTARLSTYLIECEAKDAIVASPSPPPLSPYTGTPKPAAEQQQPIPVDLSKLKLSDIRQPDPTLYPQIFEIAISNAGSDRVTELTIGFRHAREPCSRNLEEYHGFKKFSVDLLPGDSVTIKAEFSAQAPFFCIIRAAGPPLGLAACTNSSVSMDVAIAACTSVIKSGELHGADYAKAFRGRGNAYMRKGNHDHAIADYTEAMRLNPSLAHVYLNRRGYAYHAKGEYDRAIADYDEAIRMNPNYALAYHDRGFAHFAKGEHDRAIADYTEAIRLGQQHASSYRNGEQHLTSHRNRAIAYLYIGSPVKAQADLEMAAQLTPKDAYVPLWREIVEHRANRPSTLVQGAPQIGMEEWPAPIARLLLGETTPAALLASAKDPDPKKSRERLCEATYFVGQLALQKGSKEEAKRAFKMAMRDCPREFLEMGAAVAELKVLDKKQ
jgi:lipoprotein NlpI